MAYISEKRNNLKVFGISKSKTLQDFVTTEKDVQKGHNRLPLNLARLYEEDIMSDEEIKNKKDGDTCDTFNTSSSQNGLDDADALASKQMCNQTTKQTSSLFPCSANRSERKFPSQQRVLAVVDSRSHAVIDSNSHPVVGNKRSQRPTIVDCEDKPEISSPNMV